MFSNVANRREVKIGNLNPQEIIREAKRLSIKTLEAMKAMKDVLDKENTGNQQSLQGVLNKGLQDATLLCMVTNRL